MSFEFPVDRFEPDGQNADDNDQGDYPIVTPGQDQPGRFAPARKDTPMRSLRFITTVLVLVAVLRVSASGQQNAKLPAPSALLDLKPKFVQSIEYDTPADAAAINACKVETVLNDQKRSIGYVLRDAQGKLLRRFVVAHGSRIDQWSYFQDGFEVYREEDLDGDRSLDECRWLNAGGTRIGKVSGGRITGWKQITAEESSKVMVQALASGDNGLLETVMATPEDLTAAGVSKDVVAKIAAAALNRAELAAALRKKLVGWTKQTTWNRFDGTFPHVIPADPASGLSKDLTLYENAMVIPGSAGAEQNPAKLAFLQIPDMIQLGAAWKFPELPNALDPEKPIVAAGGGLRALLFAKDNGVEARDEAVDAAMKALAEYDKKNAALLQGGPKEIAQYHVGRVPMLNAVVKAIKASKNPAEQLAFNKQMVDSLVAAVRTHQYPQGKKYLEKFIADGDKLGSYASYCMIDAEFAMSNDEPNANVLANQKKWMAELDDFLKKFPDSDEAPSVLLHLANANEFNAEEKTAREQYDKLAKNYPGTEAGKKAEGALRRIDLASQPLAIKGTGIQGEPIETSQYLGKPVAIFFWASWATPVKNELPDLMTIYDKYHRDGFEVIGINVDNERADVDAFISKHKLTWPQIVEPGGMDSRLAIDYGIISLPTMFLVDAKGKVVSRNLRTAELEKQLEKLLPAKQPGVAVRPN
jgi:peroxiredoxin/TolA-binding protein